MATPVPQNEVTFSSQEILEATHGTLAVPFDKITGVRTDSREVSKGCLFVCLRGEHFDAADFLPDVIASGAAAVLVHAGTKVPAGVGVIEVPDSLTALGQLASAHRRRWGKTVVAITGSAGKTTTKEVMVAGFQHAGKRVLSTVGNLNNRVGVPMTLFMLDEQEIAIIEVGTSEPGEIATLAAIVCPDVSLVTLVALAHSEKLVSRAAILSEKTDLLRAPTCSLCIVNADDNELLEQVPSTIRSLGVGCNPTADVQVSYSTFGHGTEIAVTFGAHTYTLRSALIGEGVARAAGMSLAVASELSFDLDAVAKGIAQLGAVPGRLDRHIGVGGVLVIDDSYNANPSSVLLAIDTSTAVSRDEGRRLVCVLGDMKELGAQSKDSHAEVAEYAKKQCDVTFAFGTEFDTVTNSHTDYETLRDAVLEELSQSPESAVVLVKGSRSMKLERLVNDLVEGVA